MLRYWLDKDNMIHQSGTFRKELTFCQLPIVHLKELTYIEFKSNEAQRCKECFT